VDLKRQVSSYSNYKKIAIALGLALAVALLSMYMRKKPAPDVKVLCAKNIAHEAQLDRDLKDMTKLEKDFEAKEKKCSSELKKCEGKGCKNVEDVDEKDRFQLLEELARAPPISGSYIMSKVAYNKDGQIQKVSLLPESGTRCKPYEANVRMRVQCGDNTDVGFEEEIDFQDFDGDVATPERKCS